MTGRGDLLIALATAIAVHAGAFALGTTEVGGGGAGDAGSDRVSVEAASFSVAALVRQWDERPETFEAGEPTAPMVPHETPSLPRAETAPAKQTVPTTLAAQTAPAIAPRLAAIAPEPLGLPLDAEPPTLPETDPNTLAKQVKPAPLQTQTGMLQPQLNTAPPAPDIAPQLTERPVPRPASDPSPAVARRVAAGDGDGGIRGTTRQIATPKLSEEARHAAASAWAAAIQKRITRHHAYPRGTTAEGRVRVAMVILPDGHLDRVSVARSSGTPALDNAALAAVKRAAPFPPAPKALDDKWFDVGQWISFERR